MFARPCISFIFLALVIPISTQAAPPPAIEMSSLLEAFKVHHKSGRLDLNARTGANGAFIPKGAKTHVSLFRKGQRKPLVSHPFSARNLGGIWSNIRVNGATHFEFTDAGEYTIAYFVNGKPITAFDFEVKVLSGDDPFQPVSYRFVNGPWNDLAFLQVVNNKPSTPLTFKFWTRQETPTPDNNMKASITLTKNGELVAVAGTGAVAWAEWSLKEFSFTYPEGQGGKKFSTADLVKNDGNYTITAKFDDELQGHYPIVVKGGKIVPHKRQDINFRPSTQWLVPRRNAGLADADAIYWLDRSTTPVESSADSASTRRESSSDRNPKDWQVIPSADHKRPFELVHTKILTRRDAPLAAGDGIVAYATGRTTGVGYFRVGENKPLSIPNGQQFRGDLFHVCGKKILLANRNNLFVFDTESGTDEAIPPTDIHMRYQKAALYGPRLVDADGYLVATVNEPNRVRDRSVIKVLDLSGPKTQVISLSNIGFTVDDVSSIKVSAKHGYVAVGSSRKQAIFVAPIAPRAKLKKFDISGYDSFGDMGMALLDKYVVYQDKAGFSSIRALDLDAGEVITPDFAQHGGSWGTTVATNGQVVTWPTRDPRSTFVVSEYFKQTAPLQNSNERVSDETNYGNLGVGNVAVVAHEGTVFLSGSQSISETKCLQMATDSRWQPVNGDDGKPIPAIDVVLGDAMIAFKTGKRSSTGPVSISYATYGERIDYKGNSRVGANDQNAVATNAPNKTTPTATSPPEAEENPEIREAFLKTVLESEQTIYNALKASVGEKTARNKAIEVALQTLTKSGHENWIDEYKRRSKLTQ